jgi:hypothetical protein
MTDRLTIVRVANGWVIQPGAAGTNDFTHIAATPNELAEHVRKWAEAQITDLKVKL